MTVRRLGGIEVAVRRVILSDRRKEGSVISLPILIYDYSD